MFVNFNILNQLGSPSINSNTFANRPAAGQTGRLFVSTDTFEIYRDNGTTWDLIGGPGAGTITGSGTATQVAYFTGAQTIGSSANLFWDNTNTRLGIGTATPGSRLDIHGTGTLQSNNSTGATNNNYLALQRAGANVWRLGDTYNGGTNYFSIFNSGLSTDAALFYAATNKGEFTATETIATGLAIGTQFTYNLTVPNATTFGTPNAITALGMFTNMTLQGNSTVPIGTRQGLDASQRISFTTAGTMTVTQGGTVRAFSNISTAWSFAGTQMGTVTHLAGIRIVFPDNIGSAINITNNYGILINDQTTGLGTVTYTNRWGIYQEGASDLNYFNGNLLVKTTTNAGFAADINGTARIQGNTTILGGSLTVNASSSSISIQNAASGNKSWSLITSGNNLQVREDGIGFPMQFNAGGNVISNQTSGNFLIGTTTNAGFRLDCNGTANIRGALTLGTASTDGVIQTNGSVSLLIGGGLSTNVFQFTQVNTGRFGTLGGTEQSFFNLTIGLLSGAGGDARGNVIRTLGTMTVNTAGLTNTYNVLAVNTTINCTAGSLNTFRGFFHNPTLTATTGLTHRAIETVTGDVILGSTSGSTGIGATTTINASAILQVTSTTQGFLPPRMTTAQKNAIAAPAAGLTIYDTTLNKLCVFTGVNWETVTSV